MNVLGCKSGSAHATPFLAINDHYLYAVGLFTIDGDTGSVDSSDMASGLDAIFYSSIQIARYDLYAGTWSRVGQSFTARNVYLPSSIAFDSAGKMYVGFYLNFSSVNSDPSLSVDMLDVSSDGGATWSNVGNLTIPDVNPHHRSVPDSPAPGDTTYLVEGGISALRTDGTDIYIGGDFTGSSSVTSANLIKWNGSSWLGFGTSGSGVYATSGTQDLSYYWGMDTVNDIQVISSNVYVAGNFDYPANFLARFSTITGGALSTGDPAGGMGWDAYTTSVGGLALTVNNGNLYFGGSVANAASGFLAVCANPTASSPSWSTAVSADTGDTLYSAATYGLAATLDGNVVFVNADFTGQDASAQTSEGFSRLLVSAPIASPQLLNVQFGPTGSTAKRGLAAAGNSSCDHWNLMAIGGHGSGRGPLSLSDSTGASTTTTVTLSAGVSGASHAIAADPLLNSYVMYNTGSGTITFNGLPAGTYDFYLYGAGGNSGSPPVINATFSFASGINNPGSFSSESTSPSLTGINTWTENDQYVVFRGVQTTGSSTPVVINCSSSTAPAINGVQIVKD